MSQTKLNVQSLQVKACGPFLKDDTFSSIRKAIEPQNDVYMPMIENITHNANVLTLPQLTISTDMDGFFMSKDRFQAMIDARGFKPENIMCTMQKNSIEISAELEEIVNGYRSVRRLNRRYGMPYEVLTDSSVCALSSDGILLIQAAFKQPEQ